MKYAHIVINLPIDTHFDYTVPEKWQDLIKIGSRVQISFRNKNLIGVVVGLSNTTKIKKIKPILKLIDTVPLINKTILDLTSEVASYYCCSWGEAINCALPKALRETKTIESPVITQRRGASKKAKIDLLLIQDLDGHKRWGVYLDEIKNILTAEKEVIFLCPDTNDALNAEEILKKSFGEKVVFFNSNSPAKENLKNWISILNGEKKIIIGLRSGVFAPSNKLGLIIIDYEDSPSYKQQQHPFYHAKDVAIMRAQIENSKIILAGTPVSLDSYYAAHKNKYPFEILQKTTEPPEIRIIDMHREIAKKKPLLSTFLENEIRQTLEKNGKVALFFNRKGFALLCRCRSCGYILRCHRCNSNLIYEFSKKKLTCRLCNFTAAPSELCPQCKRSYITYLGGGTEKLESELHRLFPLKKIRICDKTQKDTQNDFDLTIFTQAALNQGFDSPIDLLGIVSADTLLNRIDYRSGEKTFSLLLRLANLNSKKMIIQTYLQEHYVLKLLSNLDIDGFYKTELKNRKQLGFPPYKHIILITLRAQNETNVKETSNKLFEKLKNDITKDAEAFQPVAAIQPKLRGNFRWQILIKTRKTEQVASVIKKNLRNFSHSGVIIGVDIDPI